MAGEFVGLGSGGKFEGDVIVVTCSVVASMTLKGRVAIVQGSAESEVRLIPSIAGEAGHTLENHPYPGRTWSECKIEVVVCEVRKERG